MRCNKSLLLVLAFIPLFSFSNTLTQTNNNFTFSFSEGNQLLIDSGVALGYIDNYLKVNNDKEGTSYQKLAASTFLQLHDDKHLLQANVNAEYLWFSQFSEDDHDEVDVKIKYFYKIDDLHRTFISASQSRVFEYRGTGSSKGSQLSADKGQEYDEALINAGYTYGRVDSVSKFSVLVGEIGRDYRTNSVINNRLDHSSKFAEIGLDYLISGKTYMSILSVYKDVEYEYAEEQDRQEIIMLAGIKWEPTSLSKVTALLGYQSLNFSEETFDDSSKFTWNVSYDWNPLDRVRVHLDSARATERSVESRSNFVIVDNISAQTTYDFSQDINISASIDYSEEETTFIAQIVSERILTAGVKINYNIGSGIDLVAGVLTNRVKSDIDLNEYNSLQFELGIKGHF